jgi:hypothetical protein
MGLVQAMVAIFAVHICPDIVFKCSPRGGTLEFMSLPAEYTRYAFQRAVLRSNNPYFRAGLPPNVRLPERKPVPTDPLQTASKVRLPVVPKILVVPLPPSYNDEAYCGPHRCSLLLGNRVFDCLRQNQ